MADQPTYLTETILTIQHEVQMALDYIETVSSEETTELGAAPSLVTIDNLRVRIPLVLQTEQETKPVEAGKAIPIGARLSPIELAQLKGQLQLRKGLLLSIQESMLGSFAKIRVISPAPAVGTPPESTPTAAPLIGELELNFVRVPRDLEKTAPPQPPAPGPSQGNLPPNIIGLTLDDAIGVLKKEGWRYEPHAASDEEISRSGQTARGRVLRQDPSGIPVDKAHSTIHFWVSLSNVPVEEIEGIGEKLGARLTSGGIATVGQLSLANISQVATILRISESRARILIDMAVMMSRLTIIGLKDEVVELLVKGAGIRSLEQLAEGNPEQIYKAGWEAVLAGKVRVRREFSFTTDDVAQWVKSARSYLGK